MIFRPVTSAAAFFGYFFLLLKKSNSPPGLRARNIIPFFLRGRKSKWDYRGRSALPLSQRKEIVVFDAWLRQEGPCRNNGLLTSNSRFGKNATGTRDESYCSYPGRPARYGADVFFRRVKGKIKLYTSRSNG